VILSYRFSARSVVLNKAAIKSTLNDIPENSKVIISAEDTVYTHDILDLIREFKDTRAVDENITVKLKGFKKRIT
jgi:predicted alpha/beta-fold hydrolase